MDDSLVEEEGEPINPDSIIQLPEKNSILIFPTYENKPQDDFIKRINKSEEKWIILTNQSDIPKLVLDADGFIRSNLFCEKCKHILDFCHEPFVIHDKSRDVGEVLIKLRSNTDKENDKPIEKDIILLWNTEIKKIITGADIFVRLLKGI